MLNIFIHYYREAVVTAIAPHNNLSSPGGGHPGTNNHHLMLYNTLESLRGSTNNSEEVQFIIDLRKMNHKVLRSVRKFYRLFSVLSPKKEDEKYREGQYIS